MLLTHPWFLFGLFSLSIPIVIHFFELQRPQRVLFTNVSFIQEVKLITAKQRKIKHLLILLARLGFLLFLVLLFCQPFVPAVNSKENNNDTVDVIIDTSASMQAEGNDDQSIFEDAVEQARDLASVYPATTHFELGRIKTPLSATAYRTAVEQLVVSAQGHSPTNDLNKFTNKSNGQGKQVFVFSDFQKSTFPAQILTAVDSTQQVFLVPLAGKQTQNIYVDSIMLDDAFVRSNTDLVLRIRLKNGGAVDVSECQGKLFVGSHQAAVFRVAVPAGQAVTSTVRIRLENPRQEQCRVTLEDSPVTFDNNYYFTLQPSPKIAVLSIAAADESAIRRLYANEPLFTYATVSPQRIEYGQLTRANMLFLYEVPQLDAGLRDNLRRFVQAGGSLVVVPPTSAAGRASYTQLFKELGLSTLQWEPAPTAGPPVLGDVAMPDLQNPFFRDVFVGQTRPAVLAKAAPIVRWSRSENAILQLRNGDGYLAQFGSGRGRVYLFAAPFSGGYSDFTTQPLFVPVMYRLAMQSYRSDERPAYRLNQDIVTLTLPESQRDASAEQVVKLTKDSLTFIPAQRVLNGVLRLEIPAGMNAPGFYNLTRNGRILTQLAFNADKRESELAAYSPAELRQLIGPNRPNMQVYDASSGQSVAARYRAERVGTPLWRYCLMLALACLLAEVLLLRFMSRQMPAVRPAEVVAA